MTTAYVTNNINMQNNFYISKKMQCFLITRRSADADKPARCVYRSVKVIKHSTMFRSNTACMPYPYQVPPMVDLMVGIESCPKNISNHSVTIKKAHCLLFKSGRT